MLTGSTDLVTCQDMLPACGLRQAISCEKLFKHGIIKRKKKFLATLPQRLLKGYRFPQLFEYLVWVPCCMNQALQAFALSDNMAGQLPMPV